MVTHVAMNNTPSTVAELRPRRGPTEAYVGTATATTPTTATRPTQDAASDTATVPPVDPETLKKAVQDLTRGVQNLQRSLQFSIDEASGRTVIKVVDKETQEVIRQIPEEDVLALAARLEDAQAGMLVKDEA